MATILTPDEIKQKIQDWITSLGGHEITGAHLNAILSAIMDYVGVGFAFKDSAPAEAPSSDVPVVYIAGPGTYTGYENDAVEVPEGSVCIFKYDGSDWSKSVLKIHEPVSVSQNTQSGGYDLAIGSDVYPLPSGEQVQNNTAKIGGDFGVNDAIYILRKLPAEDGTTDNPSGTRLRIIYKLVKGAKLSISTTWPTGVAVSLYDNLNSAILVGQYDYIETYTNWGYTTTPINAIANSDGYLSISLSNGETAITDEIRQLMLGSLDISIIQGLALQVAVLQRKDGPVWYNGNIATTQFLSNALIYRKMPASSTAEDDPNGTRLRICVPVGKNRVFDIRTSFASGIYVALYGVLGDAIEASGKGSYIQVLPNESNGYNPRAYGVSRAAGYLLISFTNGTEAISEELKQTMLNSLTISATHINEPYNESSLFVGSLVNKRLTSVGGLGDDDTKRATMKSISAVPYEGATIFADIPDGYCWGLRMGDRAENLLYNTGWILDKEFTFPPEFRYYRISFGKNNGGDIITPKEVESLIASGGLRLTYRHKEGDIISSNAESEKYIKAIMREFYNDSNLNNTLPNIAVLAHTSDIHGDSTRFGRFAKMCDYLGVDAALISGDFAAFNPDNGCNFINDIADVSNTPLLPCTGNHDTRGLYTDKEQYEQVVGHLLVKNNAITPSGKTYPTYYYKDFATRKIRLIALNTHEGQREQTDGCNITQTQAEWLIATLASTPQDYGVMLMYHELEAPVNMVDGYGTFYQPFETILIYQPGITGNPITKIVDAFIAKNNTAITYTSQGVEITVNADFTNVNSGVEFIAHICGHEHVDLIGANSAATNYQLVLDVTCGVGIYGASYPYLANISDLPRGGKGSTQDAFNIYGIDRVNKTVRVARVGSNITSEAKDRKVMIIPYVE